MKPEKVVLELEALAEAIGYSIRKEKGSFVSDHCVVSGEKCIVLNTRRTVESQIGALARVLQRDSATEQIFIKPSVRKFLDEFWAKEAQKQSVKASTDDQEEVSSDDQDKASTDDQEKVSSDDQDIPQTSELS
ncbi:MAG: hypothetical protein RI513_01220 [Balneolaceae bacterium]|nr:hypothetical protein [Balneolaceae bacterium]